MAYSISGDHLSVVRNTGAVTLVKALDHETMAMMEVIITLTGTKQLLTISSDELKLISVSKIDEKSTTAEPNIVSIRREITVEDRNDNPPKFSDASYSFAINETVAMNSQVFNKILVSDADSGSNAEIKLTCLRQV